MYLKVKVNYFPPFPLPATLFMISFLSSGVLDIFVLWNLLHLSQQPISSGNIIRVTISSFHATSTSNLRIVLKIYFPKLLEEEISKKINQLAFFLRQFESVILVGTENRIGRRNRWDFHPFPTIFLCLIKRLKKIYPI